MAKTNQAAQITADGLIGVAQVLEAEAKRLRRDARAVRAGELIPSFAASYGRNARYTVASAVDAELPETLTR